MLAVTGSDFARMRNTFNSALAFKTKYKERIDALVEHFVEASVMSATGFSLGMLDGYFLDKGGFAPVPYVPASLVAAVGGHAAAVFLGGKSAPYLHMVGNAAAVYFSADMGRRIAYNRKHGKQDLLAKITVAGELGPSAVGTHLSDEELAAAAASV